MPSRVLAPLPWLPVFLVGCGVLDAAGTDIPMKPRLLIAGLALSASALNCCSKTPVHRQTNGQKQQNIVIALDKNGNIYWNGKPIKQTELRVRFQQELKRAQAKSKAGSH